jgi:hypothetical protein
VAPGGREQVCGASCETVQWMVSSAARTCENGERFDPCRAHHFFARKAVEEMVPSGGPTMHCCRIWRLQTKAILHPFLDWLMQNY